MRKKLPENRRSLGIKLPSPQARGKPQTLPAAKGSVGSTVKFKRILVPIDFSKPSLKALRYAVRFAEDSGATLDLVYVRESAAVMHDLEIFPLAIPEAELDKHAKEKLLAIAAVEIEELVPVQVHVRFGKAFREIVAVASETTADLVVIATHGHTGLSRILLGSTAELVVRHAPCPVLVVREHEHEFV